MACTLCPKKYPRHRLLSIVIDCYMKKDDQILIVFGLSIPDTTGHQTTIQVPTSPSDVPALPGEMTTSEILHYISMII